MTTTTSPLPAGRFATYYLIPVIPGDGGSESVLFYEVLTKPGEHETYWRRVSEKSLNSRSKAQGRQSEFVCLVQPLPDDLPGELRKKLHIDPSVTLFAGVAKTLDADYLLPNLYSATKVDGRFTMVLTVVERTVRGLILVFVKDVPGEIVPRFQLIASTDPQITNSTDG